MPFFNSIKRPHNYTELLQWVTYLWAGSICFPALQGTFYAVFALVLWGLVRGQLGFSFNYKKRDVHSAPQSEASIKEKATTKVSFWKARKTPFYFLLAYLLWMTATIFWSEDIREYFR